MNKRRVVVLMPNEKPQLPLKHYLEEDSYHLQQQRLQPVIQNIQKRRKLNEASSNSIELHLEQQQQQIKIQIQTTQPIATFEIPELDIHGKSWSQKPTNVVRSRPSLIGRFRGNVCISSHQLSDETVQLNQLKINHFESVKEKVPINNNNNSLVLPYQKNMTPENDESQKTIDNLSSNFNNQLNENIHQQEVSTSTTNKCMIPVDTPSITVADHDLGNENREFSILNIIPSLISEKNRKAAFVENLVDTAGLIIEVIWANFSVNPSAKIIPLRLFLQETLRRSRTSYSTLQTALFYLFRIKPQISPISRRSEYPLTPTSELPPDVNQSQNNDPATCGRRMFLASLIVASKYLQDRNYSNRAWSKISGLPVSEINANEICFLKLIDYNLFIAEDIFKRWSSLLLSHIQAISGSDINNPDAFRRAENQREVAKFRETLRSMDPKTMDYKHTCVGIYPATPADSAPSSPKECSSEVMQASNSYTLSSIIQQPTPPISYGNFVDRTNRTLDNYVN